MNFFINLLNYGKKNISPHKHDDYETFIYIKGTGIFHANNRTYPVKEGTIVVVPPGIIHHTIPDGELENIYMRGNIINRAFNFTSPVILADNKKNEGMHLSKIIYDNRHGNPDYIAALCNAYIHFILQNFKMEDSIGSSVNKIIMEITDNFCDSNIHLSLLLNQSGYAEDYIRTHFKKITGKTPTVFLNDIRIKHACYLIETYQKALPLSEIAEQCGYTDYIYFSRKFTITSL